MVHRREFLRRAVGLAAWGIGTPLAWQWIWPRPVFAADYPFPLEMRRVTSSSQLQDALDFSSPGSHVVLADGDYSGDFVMKNHGASGAPIVLRSENPLGARINGRLDLTGQNSIAHGLVLDNGQDYAMEIAGDGNKVLRSHFPGPRGVSLTNGTRNYHIGNNLFDGDSYPSPRNSDEHRQYQVYVKVKGGEGNPPEPGLIDGNHFIDRYDGEVSENHGIYVGDSYDPDSEPLDLLIQGNLLGSEGDHYQRRRGVYVKRGCKIYSNHAVMDRGTFGIRHGNGGEMAGNNLEGNMLATVNGDGHKVTGNRWRCRLFALNCTHRNGSGGGPDGKGNQYQAANDCITEGNDGDVTVGYMARGGSLEKKVGGVNLYGHNGQVIREQEEGTVLADGGAPVSPVSLTPADVGPNAPARDRPAAFTSTDPFAGFEPPPGAPELPEAVPNSPLPATRRGGMREGPAPRATTGVKMHQPKMPNVDLDALFGKGA